MVDRLGYAEKQAAWQSHNLAFIFLFGVRKVGKKFGCMKSSPSFDFGLLAISDELF